MKKLGLWSLIVLLAFNAPVMSVSAYCADGSFEDEQQVMVAEKYVAGSEEEQVRAFVERMYTIVLGRTADANGISDWTKALLEHNIDGAGIVSGFVGSEEFLAKGLNNEEYVNVLYRAMMDREADEAGRATWIDFMSQGKSRGAVLAGFVNSTEFRNICFSFEVLPGSMDDEGRVNKTGIRGFVDRLYTKVLGRDADEKGAQDWANHISLKIVDAETVAKSFFCSDEFINRNLSNEEFVETLYVSFLDRKTDADGKTFWSNQLQNGMGRMDVLEGFSRSAEFSNLMRTYGLGTSYFEEYGIPVQNQITDFTSIGYIYDRSTIGNGDENVNYKLANFKTKVKEVSRTPLDNGYENIRCVLQFSTTLHENAEGSFTSCMSYGNNLYDYHTGVRLRARSTSGDDGFSYVTPIMFNDKQYNISYSANVSWEYSDWCYEEWDDSYWCSAMGTVVMEVKAPAGYDGLVFGVYPKTGYESSSYEDPADQISYVPTNPKEGSVFYRINP